MKPSLSPTAINHEVIVDLHQLHKNVRVLQQRMRPTWIAQVREIPQGARVGYGSTYLATQDERVATLPIGYSDGLKKSLCNGGGEVIIRGVRCPIRGTISSASAVVGVTHVPGDRLKAGEEVLLIGSQGGCTQQPDEMAAAAGTGHLDLLAGIMAPISYTPSSLPSCGDGSQGG